MAYKILDTCCESQNSPLPLWILQFCSKNWNDQICSELDLDQLKVDNDLYQRKDRLLLILDFNEKRQFEKDVNSKKGSDGLMI